MTRFKPLYIDKADFYENYRHELLQGFMQHILPTKFCTLAPDLLSLYRERDALFQPPTMPLRESIFLSLFESPSCASIFSQKKYTVCALAAGATLEEERFVQLLRERGKKCHFVIQDSSITSCTKALESTSAELGVATDIMKESEYIRHIATEHVDPQLPILYLLLGFTFASLPHYQLLSRLRNMLRPMDKVIIDIPLFDSPVSSSHISNDHTYLIFSPLLSEDVLREVAYFYGVPKDAALSFRTQFDEKPLFGGFRKDMMITFEKPCTVHYKDISWNYGKGESLSLFRMQFFGLDEIRTLFSRSGFEELEYITIPSYQHLSASLHILSKAA